MLSVSSKNWGELSINKRILAKTKIAHKHLQAQFAHKSISKKYIAILEGHIEKESGYIHLPIRPDLDNRPQQMVCFEHGKTATTEFTFLKRKGKRSKVAFYPITGRTHQLRVHSAHPKGLNMSIVGDDLYGTVEKRLMLHAQEITFVHPSKNQEITLSTPDPF